VARLSSYRFRYKPGAGEAAAEPLACNRGNLWGPLALPKRIENLSLTSLQQRLLKTGVRLHFSHDGVDRRPLGRPGSKSAFKQRSRGRNGGSMLPSLKSKRKSRLISVAVHAATLA
jgi:hypothetical protein